LRQLRLAIQHQFKEKTIIFMFSGVFMNRVYLIRHGENEANITKEFSYRMVDYSLTAKGVLQAQQTAAYWQDKPIDAIYTSPLKRALETAEIIAEPHGLPVIVLEDLREVNVGSLEGQPFKAENWKFYNQMIKAWFDGDKDRAFPDGETYHQLWGRLRRAFADIVRGRDDQDIIVVGHGGNFSAIMKDLCPNADVETLIHVDSPNCSITDIRLGVAGG
jgi:broad specificity phosphatase PhoE